MSFTLIYKQIGLLVTLAATIIVALYTSYINSENNRRYQESLNNNNDNSPAPALPPRPTPSPCKSLSVLMIFYI